MTSARWRTYSLFRTKLICRSDGQQNKTYVHNNWKWNSKMKNQLQNHLLQYDGSIHCFWSSLVLLSLLFPILLAHNSGFPASRPNFRPKNSLYPRIYAHNIHISTQLLYFPLAMGISMRWNDIICCCCDVCTWNIYSRRCTIQIMTNRTQIH